MSAERDEDRRDREARDQEEIAAIRGGFEAMRAQEINKQRQEMAAGMRRRPEREAWSGVEQTTRAVGAFVRRVGDVLVPRRFDRIGSSVMGLNLFKKDKVIGTELEDGTELRPGDKYARLHLTLERWKPKKPEVEEDFAWVLDELANRAATDPRYKDIEAFQAVSHLLGDETCVARFREMGFEIRDIKNPAQRLFHAFTDSVQYALARGWRRASKKEIKVREAWISREKLLDYRSKHPVV